MRLLITIMLVLSCFMLISCSSEGNSSDSGLDRMFHSELSPVIITPIVLIEEDFADEKITLEEYLLYSAAAHFDKGSLPSEYEGEDIPPHDYSMIVQMISENFDALSPFAQNTLRQYILTPDNPDSYWYDGKDILLEDYDDEVEVSSAVAHAVDWITLVPFADAVVHKSPTNHEFEIFYPTAAEKPQAIKVVDALMKSQAKYIASGYPEIQEWIYVKLKDMPPNSQGFITYGLAGMLTREGKSRCHIILNTRNDEKRMKTVVAHELFHCVQYQMGHKAWLNKWLLESTATWSEHHVYPTENTEHERDTIIFPHLNNYMLKFGNLHEYGSYLWWFYLEQEYSSFDIIRSSLVEGVSVGQKKMLKNRAAFSEELKDYAVWNVNFEPFKYYTDHAGEPTSGVSSPASEEYDLGTFKKKFDIDLNRGGILYRGFFVDEKVDKLKFDLTPFTGSGIGVQILYQILGEWHQRDVSHENEVVFCRSRPEQEVDYAIVVFSNPNLDDMFLGELEVDATEACEKGWVGTIKFSWSSSGSMDISDMMLSDDGGNAESSGRGNFVSEDVLVYDKVNDDFIMKEQRATYSSSSQEKITYNRGCGYLWEEKGAESAGSASGYWEVKKRIEDSDGPTRLKGIDDEDGRYTINLDIFEGTVRYSSYNSASRRPCGLDGYSGMGEAESYRDEFDGESDGDMVSWPNHDFILVMNDKKDKLVGEGTAYFQPGDKTIPVQFTAEYNYVG